MPIVVAVKKISRDFHEVSVVKAASTTTLQLIQSSFSSRKASRKSFLLAGLHRVVDGALFGIVIAVAFMSAITLHLQHRWTLSFMRLESTRMLIHRLTDSTAMLERYLLEDRSTPQSMVPTKVNDLLYLERPLKGLERGRRFWWNEHTKSSIGNGY